MRTYIKNQAWATCIKNYQFNNQIYQFYNLTTKFNSQIYKIQAWATRYKSSSKQLVQKLPI